MDPLSPTERAFLAAAPVGVLGTQRSDGSIRQSVVYHLLDGDRLLISTQSARVKAHDVQRTGWASHCALGQERPFPSLTVEGTARIITSGIGDATAALFTRIFGIAAEPMSDAELAAIDRVILELTIERAYGASYLPEV